MSLFGTLPWRKAQPSLVYSVDLTEATYNLSHDLLNANYEFLDEEFKDNPVWEVYGDLLRVTDREIDFSEVIDQGFDAPVSLRVSQGAFMGDGLSFMHLTLAITCLVNLGVVSNESTLHKLVITRPLGQSVGDDLLLLEVTPKQVAKCDQELVNFGLPTSKIHSAFHTGVFAEQYFKKLLQASERDLVQPESLFGDLWFVDSIKTMLLTGKPKVSSEKRNSFIGQANALNKQLAYLPPNQRWKKLKARIYLWANNYWDAIRVGRAKPHLPPELGGIDTPLGACDGPETALMRTKYIPYLSAIAKLPREEFLFYHFLLKGIFRSTPKGVPWSNDPERLNALIGVAALVPREVVEKTITDSAFYHRLGQMEKLRYLSRTHNWVSASDIDDELSRRETYLEFWYEPGKKRDFRTLRSGAVEQRFNDAWNVIHESVEPDSSCQEFYAPDGFRRLAALFKAQTWGFFISRDDPAISWVFENVNTFWLDVKPT